MDRGARDRVVNERVGQGISTLLLLAFLLMAAGCHQGWHGGTTPPPGPEKIGRAPSAEGGDASRASDPSAPAAVIEWLPPAVATEEAADATGRTDDGHGWPSAEEGRDASRVSGTSADNTSSANTAVAVPSADGHGLPRPSTDNAAHSFSPRSVHKSKPAAAPHPVPAMPPKDTRGASPPGWAKSPEELVYRVDFIGITMGYARFRYEGKVSIAGKPAYHLNVRAWTSGVLSYIYPINETIDYYLDTESLAPIRQEFTQREKDMDDVALYNQETGRITYRYRQSGKIRKEVDTIPSVYDPVSVAYYFRWRDLGAENRPRNVYGGRKVYQIASRVLGYERIRTERGEVDTIAVLPLIRRDGKPDDKGDLKIWFSNDERRVPVRLYAKFHKIKDWTLVGELMPSAAKAGG